MFKKWTVMLIPHDRSSTRTVTVSAFHMATVPVVLALLGFATAFLYAREQAMRADHQQLRDAYRSLEIRSASRPAASAEPTVAKAEPVAEEQVAEIEARQRADYEASIAKITSELNALYDMEAKARQITGMAPRKGKAAAAEKPAKVASKNEGKGGPESFGSYVYSTIDESLRPPHVIYGLSRPSADLILQEIRMRRESLSHLVKDMEVASDKVESTPSIWPLKDVRGKITSRFGYRIDPINFHLRRHEGVDISAPTGTTIVSTAKGTVSFSGYESDYGNCVRVEHGNGLQTVYAHMSARSVKVGDKINRGDVLGKVGSTGRSTGAHLHFEVRINGKAVDGSKYLN